ncbi:hypothetical protein [Agrobacterium rosae]|uniref:hypothetical protein n=1 Tax=Agrobacterium rosae TaxID=1972867 RepID=UPI00122F789E|nr:hypothetical protein [Agrobacterium rosae]KAA3510087.1 hypothetical protein DXM21_19855 [Agrobacterium rosae]KAA3514968.1 hypothetical protein DXM25_20515 [Agrobacterium rosae]MQB50707.1 hypothetical protein [Agrobacterium rosae]
MATVRDVQRRLIALGFQLPQPKSDGKLDEETILAINTALDELEKRREPRPDRGDGWLSAVSPIGRGFRLFPPAGEPTSA